MSLDEKIGQLFMIPVCPLREDSHFEDVFSVIKNYHIGSVIVKASDPISQVRVLNKLQAFSKLPLLVAIDAENGLGMRMEGVISFPLNLTLGAIQDESLIYLLGKEIARQCQLVGAHINLAPVVDVNSNPNNPIIHMRSFGDDKFEVAKKAKLIMRGMEDNGIFSCAKHFPNHGDTKIDSHLDLPIIEHEEDYFYSDDIFTFSSMIENNISCVMGSHILFPKISKHPATLSYEIIKELLQKNLKYNGLVITDALNMKALKKYYSIEEIAILSFLAGNDILLYGDHIEMAVDDILQEQIPKAFNALKEAFLNNTLSINELDKRVEKILAYKKKKNLFASRYVDEENLLEDLHTKQAIELNKKLYEEAITYIGDKIDLNANIAYLPIGSSNTSTFINELEKSLNLSIFNKEDDYDFIIVPIFNITSPRDKYFGLNEEDISLINKLDENKTILVVFGSPYILKAINNKKNVLIAYENNEITHKIVAKIILNKKNAKGKLPISYQNTY